ncbi:Gx transporter family protein [bacterium]|nr:Gx transporter family protein [bacterium]
MTGGSSPTRRLVMISMLSAFGLILFVFESFLPVLPWFRPGLGNIATILALLLYGFGDAIKVTLLRVVLGALILGRLFTPVFVFAVSGGLASALVMVFVLRYTRNVFGPVGISVLGALAHNIIQLVIAYFFFVKSVEMFIFIPVFIFTGVITGNITGLIAAMVLERGSALFAPEPVRERETV